MNKEAKIQVENQKWLTLAIKQGIISQLYKDGFLTENIYRRLTLSIGFSLEKPAKKAAEITKDH
ncbi:hypothetical protein FRZ06_13175 [Anoxybacterium hadale]|uniref:Uncharacterized protein n=1 Tax=Anoxybacterium hadale TaxID=3408580 RepID=A0ACD1ACF0_9FIRM|nr:hypothetical protein FRZ06_13175 [Clostridiales bacterium]